MRIYFYFFFFFALFVAALILFYLIGLGKKTLINEFLRNLFTSNAGDDFSHEYQALKKKSF